MSDREGLTEFLYARLDQDDLYDGDGIMLTDRRMDEYPWIAPDFSDTGAPALLADAILASGWLAQVKAAAVEDALAFLATTPAVTITGKGGAAERLRQWVG